MLSRLEVSHSATYADMNLDKLVRMRFVFEFDTEINEKTPEASKHLEAKLIELRKLENLIRSEMQRNAYESGDVWLKSLQDKSF